MAPLDINIVLPRRDFDLHAALTLGAETRVLGAGEAAIVAADQPHSARATEPTRAIVVDYPLRDTLGGIRLR